MKVKKASLELLKFYRKEHEKSKKNKQDTQDTVIIKTNVIAYDSRKVVSIPKIEFPMNVPQGSFNTELRQLFYGFKENRFLYERFKSGMPASDYFIKFISHLKPVTGEDVFLSCCISELSICEQIYCLGRHIFSHQTRYLHLMKAGSFLVLGFQYHESDGLCCIGVHITKPFKPMAIPVAEKLPSQNVFVLIEKSDP